MINYLKMEFIIENKEDEDIGFEEDLLEDEDLDEEDDLDEDDM